MLQVQTFATITNLLLVLSEICNNHQPPFGTSKLIFWTIHCKHHSWSTCTTGRFVLTLESSFTITRRTIHGFTTSIHGSTTSIGLQHFQQICRVSMFSMEVPQPLQQPMLLYKPLASFVSLYTHPTSKRCFDLYTKFQRLYHSSLEIYLQYLKWVFHEISFGFLV
jgi:hypothetical protein